MFWLFGPMIARGSETSDVDVRNKAHQLYKDEYKIAFTMVKAWELLRSLIKWHLVPPLKICRLSFKTSSSTKEANFSQGYLDAVAQINLSDTDDELDFDFPEELVRSIGRDKAKAKARSSSSTSATVNPEIKPHIESLDSEIDHLLGFRNEQQLGSDFAFLEKDLSHLPPEVRAIFELRKNKIHANE